MLVNARGPEGGDVSFELVSAYYVPDLPISLV